MATYGNRPGELAQLLKSATPEGTDERITRKLGDCVKAWGDKREDHLEALADFAERASAGNLGTAKKWQDRIKAARGEVSSMFADAVDDLMLPAPLQLFWFATVTAEDKFFESLGAVGTPQLYDDLLVHQDTLSKLIGELADKWEFLIDRNNVFKQGQHAQVKRAEAIVQKLIGELDSHYAKLSEHAAKMQRALSRISDKIEDKLGENLLLELLKKAIEMITGEEMPDDLDVPLEAWFREYQAWTEKLAAEKERYRDVVESYKDALSSEKGSVIALFNTTREDVMEYREKNDIPEAKVRYDQAKGQLTTWAGKRPTTGQRNDAAAFCAQVFKPIDAAWKITQDLDKDFRKRFSGVFFDALGSQTIEDLAELYYFEREVDRITSPGAHRLLAGMESKLEDQIEDAVDDAFDTLDDAIRDLPSEVRRTAELDSREFRSYVEGKLRDHMRKLLPVIDELRKMLDPSKVEDDWSREELEDALD